MQAHRLHGRRPQISMDGGLPSSWSSQQHRVYREPQWIPLYSEEQLPPFPFPSSNLKAFVRLCMLKSGSLAVSSGNLGSPTHPPPNQSKMSAPMLSSLNTFFLYILYIWSYIHLYTSLYVCVCMYMCVYIYIISVSLS